MGLKQVLFLSVFIFVVVLISQISFGQKYAPPPLIAPSTGISTPLPTGSGARALGQGGAFIAVADDATAASWNPAGLVQLERPEFSVVGSFLSTQQDFSAGSTESSDITPSNETVSRGDLNFISVAYPFRVFGKNMVAALNYQQMYDFHMKLKYYQVFEKGPLGVEQTVDFESKGGIGALTPAVSMRVNPKISVGISINYFTDEFFGDYAWKQTARATGSGYFGDENYSLEYYMIDKTFKGFQAINVTTGMLWNVWEKENKRLTIGAFYDTPYTADVDSVSNGRIKDSFGEGPIHERKHYEIDYPMSFGAGMNFRASDEFSFSMDVTWTDWSEFDQEDEDGNKTRPLGGVSTDRKIDDTYAVRCGTEYLIFIQKMIIPVRGGLFYDPRPSLDDPTDVYGFSVGSGVTFKRFSIDGAYQFRWSNNVDGEDLGLDGTHFDLTEHMFLASVIVYF